MPALGSQVALFAVIVGLAAQNRLRLVPALAHDLAGGGHGCESVALLRSCIRAELVLGMLVPAHGRSARLHGAGFGVSAESG
jgi:putative copper export protein